MVVVKINDFLKYFDTGEIRFPRPKKMNTRKGDFSRVVH